MRKAPFAAMKLSILLPRPSLNRKTAANDSMLESLLSSMRAVRLRSVRLGAGSRLSHGRHLQDQTIAREGFRLTCASAFASAYTLPIKITLYQLEPLNHRLFPAADSQLIR